ncbi:hypothetical protein DL96DRAFT_1605120 [Flagelloscypha sp. PMI_526]|nr:hypothetical protein DL96DRAFT_1605120 [Flagelloscypha sp. PMI_526]
MSGATTVDIPQTVSDQLRKFRFRKTTGTSALVVKINKPTLTMEVVETLDDVTIEEIAEELPENSPRYVVLSHELNHSDGRKSYPLALINWAPTTSEISLMTLHASALINFQRAADVAKVLECREGPEQLTTEFVNEKLTA